MTRQIRREMMIITRIAAAALVAALLPAGAMAAGGAGHVDDIAFSFEGPLGKFEPAQLQRGLQVFNEVCSACHGMKFVSFRSLGEPGGPGYDDAQVKALAALYEVPDQNGDLGDMRTALPVDNFPANEAMNAPDLSLMAKARAGFHGPVGLGINQFVKGIGGPEYLYSVLTNYTGEEVEVAGVVLYGNRTMAGGLIAMSPPLMDDLLEYADGTPATSEQMAEDVSAFLMWTAEPKMSERKSAGVRNFLFIAVLSVLLYLTNKKLWMPIKHPTA
jgi:ubiquinol-cytochrome c reductase cytochrome c1 subunit